MAYRRGKSLLLAIILGASLVALGCGSASTPPPGSSLQLSLASNMALAPQDGTPAIVDVTVTRTGSGAGSVTLSATGLPAGLTASFQQPGAGSSGSVTFVASNTVPSGNHSVSLTASDGTSSSTQSILVVVAVATALQSATDSSLGVGGKLQEFMSTSFQPAEWDYKFFQNLPSPATANALNDLQSQHVRIQFLSQAVPMRASSQPPVPTDWDFSKLDAILQPVLGVTDNSPELQIAVAPPLPGMLDANGHLIVNSTNLTTFAQYCANLVRYYNTGGFDWGGQHFQSPSPHHVTWWGIFNEYNINGLTPAEYVQLYNTVVPAMSAVDPTIKFSAVELADFDFQEGDPRNNLPTFVLPANGGGVNAQVDIVSTHFYSSCNQTDSDQKLMDSVASFANDVKYIYSQLKARPDLAVTPVWVTENNVNADFSNASGNSTCNPGQKFVTDKRGSSAFFAAWRPYVFSLLGKAGNQALYHWDYDADAQYGEVDFNTGNKYLSYWVDYWLARMLPASPAGDILVMNLTESSASETLAVKFADGHVVIMVANRAVQNASDNNGAGDPRVTTVDISSLGPFSSASQLTIDKNTDVVNGPVPVSIALAPKFSISLTGYGVSFVTLKP